MSLCDAHSPVLVLLSLVTCRLSACCTRHDQELPPRGRQAMLRCLLPLLLLLLPHAGGTAAFARRRSPTLVAQSTAWQSAVDPASGRTYY